jgi:hypothetical protein
MMPLARVRNSGLGSNSLRVIIIALEHKLKVVVFNKKK